jgi:hypothetical protein
MIYFVIVAAAAFYYVTDHRRIDGIEGPHRTIPIAWPAPSVP